jgi:hypothetical protein
VAGSFRKGQLTLWLVASLVLVGALTVPASATALATGITTGGAPAAVPTEAHSGSSTRVLSLVPEPSGTPDGCVVADLLDPYPQMVEGHFAFQGNLYSLPSGAVGTSTLCYHPRDGTLTDRTQFVTLPGAPQHGVLGYPEAILGQNIYGGYSGSGNSILPLPNDRFGNLTSHDVWITLDYRVQARGNSPYDFALDDWFSASEANSGSTGNVGDRIEVMVWFSNDIGMYLSQKKVDIPTYLDGTTAPGTWYRDDLCMGSQDITFDYLYAPNGQTPGYGMRSARLAVNITAILANVASVISGGACWAPKGTSVSSFYADNFPIGAEFYPTTSDTARVDWRISELCYTLVVGRASAGSVSCHPNGGSDSSSPDTAADAQGVLPFPPATARREAVTLPPLVRWASSTFG